MMEAFCCKKDQPKEELLALFLDATPFVHKHTYTSIHFISDFDFQSHSTLGMREHFMTTEGSRINSLVLFSN